MEVFPRSLVIYIYYVVTDKEPGKWQKLGVNTMIQCIGSNDLSWQLF